MAGLLLALGLTSCGRAAPQLNNQGNEAFAQGDFQAAIDAYGQAIEESPDVPELSYNAGNAHYRQEEYDDAQRELQQALLGSEGDLTENGYFNLGNSLFSTQQLESSIDAYKEVLRLNPDDLDAKYNLELALQQLQQQQQEQEQQEQEEQARQLLTAVGQDTESLQAHLQQVYEVRGNPPAQDW